MLERFEDENYRFSFDEEWLADPERPILGQLFEDRRPYDIETSGMACWFAHLLPQDPLRRFLARHEGVDDRDDFAVLAASGRDLPGAVVLEPGESPLSARRTPAAMGEGRGVTPGLRLGFSLGGAQWKLSVRRREGGLTIPARGESGDWIAKFDDPRHPGMPRVEYATTSWARSIGIEVPEVRLGTVDEFETIPEDFPTGDGVVFLTRRFDRDGNVRIHMEDFGQITDRPPGDRQYDGRFEDIAIVLGRIAPDEVRAFVERLSFCVVSGNGDAHLKNWSVLYPDRRTPRLSPAYDLVSTVAYSTRYQALTLGGTRELAAINESAFDLLAAVCDREASIVRAWAREAASKAHDVWHAENAHYELTERQRRRITDHVASVRLGR
jgi:serine/threonine-protein kinase HipA